MKALSLTRPWPDAILKMGKRVENRARKDGKMPAMCHHRGPLLLHAAKSHDGVGFHRFMRDVFHSVAYPPLPEIPAGVIFARCHVVGHVEPPSPGDDRPLVFADGAEGDRLADDGLDLRWWMGGYAMVLADVEPTPLVPCRGALGLWTPPADVLAQLGVAS